mgnify:CR=1 FL=1
MSHLTDLIKKEVRDLLREPHILIFAILLPAVMYIVMGVVITGAMESALEQATTTGTKVAVINFDKGIFSILFIKFLEQMPQSNVTILNTTNIHAALKFLEGQNIRTLIIIPKDFSNNISSGTPTYIRSISIIKELSLSSIMGANIISGVIQAFSKTLLTTIVKEFNIQMKPEFIIQPIKSISDVYIRNKFIPSEILSNAFGMIFSIVFVPLIVIGYIASISATSMGIEKEEKTLEVLLTLPVNRIEILISKLTGSFIISLLASVSAGIGFWFYITKIMSVKTKPLISEIAESSITSRGLFEIVSLNELTLIIPALLLTILLVAVIGFIAGALSQNVRSAQSIAGFIWIPLFLVIFPLAYLELASLDLTSKMIIAIIPFSSPIIAIKVMFSNEYYVLMASLLATVAYLVILLFLATKLLSSERLLLGIKWRRKF